MLRKKSLLALLLSLCMVVGILPTAVFAAGQYVPENPRWSGHGNQVIWDKPVNASDSTYFEYEAQLVQKNDRVFQTKSVEINRWVFFNNLTEPQEAYTLRVRARQIHLTGDPDGSYTVWQIDDWGDWAYGGNTGGGEGPTPPHEHSFGGWKNDGTNHWKKCSCGEISEKSPHDFGEWELIDYNPTTGKDMCERFCRTCGYKDVDEYREHQHYYGNDWSSNSTKHWKVCFYCKQAPTSVAEHSFSDWSVTKPATTTEEGLRERTCSVCEYTQKETIPVHVHSIHDETWKYDDTNHWQECSCGEKLNVANHAYGEWRVTKPATETEAGSKARDCTVCDYVQTETIPMLQHDHSYGDWQSNDTQHWKECRCSEKIEVGDHTYGEWKITKKPTTEETGTRERTCSTCNYKDRETLPVHEHSHNNKWEKDDAQHWRLCSCGEKFDIADHSFDNWTITKEPTTTETGSRERTCSICKYTQTETLPVHTHDVHDEEWKYDETEHWQECSCGERLNVAKHTYDAWRETKPATETEEGSRERGCTVCEYVQVEDIPMIEHEHGIHDETWKYDKTDHWQECSCGEKLNVANHTYGDWKVTKEATETEAGSRERGCAVCEYVQTEAIPAAGTGEPTDSTDPTDSSDSQGQQDPSGDTGSPQTGDGSDMALWIGLMLASCGGVLGMLLYRRKKAAAGK